MDNNFRVITLPFSELGAYSLGAQSVFQGNTPTTFFEDSLSRLATFLQDQGQRRIRSAEEYDRILRENTPPDQRGEVFRTPPIIDSRDSQQSPICTDQNANIIPCDQPGAIAQPDLRRRDAGVGATVREGFSLGAGLEQFFTSETAKDVGKRIAIVAVALLLILGGIISLR